MDPREGSKLFNVHYVNIGEQHSSSLNVCFANSGEGNENGILIPYWSHAI